MVYRKLIKFGNSSHVVSIPKTWMDRNKLKAGDVVHFNDSGHELNLQPTAKDESYKSKSIVINVQDKSISRLHNEIFSAYVNSYNTIKITGKGLENKSKQLRNFLHNFVALEIVEQTSHKIVAKDFLNVQDISVNDMLRRMDIIIRSMFEDLLECIKNKKDVERIADKIYDRDTDVNRLYFLLIRVIKGAMNNPNISNSLNLYGTDSLSKWLEVIYLEDFADEIKRVARFLKKTRLSKKQEDNFHGLHLDLQKLYLDTRKALYNNDIDLAHDISSSREVKLIERCNDFVKKHQSPEIGIMLERVKKMASIVNSLAVVVHDNQ